MKDIMIFIGIATSVASILWIYFGCILKQNEQLAEVKVMLCERMKAVETKVELFWNVVTDGVKGMLKHPDAVQKDFLLEKLPHLDKKEAIELRAILKNEFYHANDKEIKLAYILVLARIEIILHDLEETGGHT